MTTKKATKLQKMKQSTGQLVEPRQFRTLDELFGGGDFTKYKTLDQDAYIKSLDEMNMSELQSHATSVGLAPIDDHKRLKRTLIEEFKSFAKVYRPHPVITKVDNDKVSKETMKILAEGR